MTISLPGHIYACYITDLRETVGGRKMVIRGTVALGRHMWCLPKAKMIPSREFVTLVRTSQNSTTIHYSQISVYIDVVVLLPPELCEKFEWSTVNGAEIRTGCKIEIIVT